MTKRIAITGFSFRFPGTNINSYWQDLLDGRNLVTEVDPQRWAQNTFRHPDEKHPGTSYTFAAGSIGDISQFDAGFFGISPREAALMDPQHRLLLEMSWEALENSGVKPSTIRGSQCGVFIGIASADYSYRLADDLAAITSSVATGNTASIAANRISYVFDLHGPSMAIDTACSSSMVAFHQACRSILSGESDQALVGGVSLHLHPYGFITFSKASMLSPRGRCSVFDASGDGYVRSEGGGVFFLKDYDQALADGNPILATVVNCAINTDGRKSGLTVPNPNAQAVLLEQAYSQVGIDPAAIDYIEAHGTGTVVGDPIEAQAIGNALGKRRPINNPLPIGSVKSNLGHLEAASGIAGLVKALYCIRHRMVPATIGLETPHPHIPFDDLNIKVVTQNLPLKQDGTLIVGVNSFGFGGANAHVILESHEQPKLMRSKLLPNTLLPIILSAKDDTALKAAARDFSVFLKSQSQTALYDIAYNSIFRREWHGHRAILCGVKVKSIAQALHDYADEECESSPIETGVALRAPCGPAFIYSGNGSQWAGMGKRLLENEPLFREAVRTVDILFRRHADYSLEDELAGRNGEDRYGYTEVAQPALFALQVGITQMLRHRGITPVAVAGHSVGEVAAAWASGALTLDAAVEVVYHRSRLQGTTKGKGEMTAVGLGHAAAQDLLVELGFVPSLVIAGVNSSRGVTIAGSAEQLFCLESTLVKREIFHKRLALDYAFHSPAMDKIEVGVRQALGELHASHFLVPFYSTVTGSLLHDRKLDAEYWWQNIRQPVLFEQAIKSMLGDGINLFVEIGPHAVLRGYINDCLKDREIEGRVIPTVVRGDDSSRRVWGAWSQTLIAGAVIDWQHTFLQPARFVRLPNYPWQHERHWHPVTPESIGLLDRHKVHPLLGYSLKQHELVWENQFDTKCHPTMADHVVGGSTVFPGTGFTELALAAALAWRPGDLAEIEELEIRTPLFLSDVRSKLVRLSIEPQDGSLTIKGREYAGTESWTLHAVARILREPHDILMRRECPGFPARRPDFTKASHELLTRAAGLAYGPAFQCIDYGWIEKEGVLAVLKIPECIAGEVEHVHLHPALLDCTFQLIIQLLKEDVDMYRDVIFVPVKMGRISFRSGKRVPGIVRATLLRRNTHSLIAEFIVFDTNGEPVAVLKDVRFRSIRLKKNTVAPLHFLDYHGIPKPNAFAPDAAPVITFEGVRSAFAELARRAALKGTHRRYTEEVDPLLDSLCSRFIRQALQRLSEDGVRLSAHEISGYRRVTPEIEPFLAFLLSIAQDDQSVAPTQDGWQISPGRDEQVSAQDIWNSLIADYPDYFQIVHAVGRIGMHLQGIINGSLSPEQVFPQGASMAMLTRLVFGAGERQKVGHALRELIIQGMNELPAGQRLRLMEVSEGVPSFLMDVCAVMDSNCCDYVFAGTSTATLEEISWLKERFPCIDTHLIRTPTAQPMAVSPCQVAIVTLDFNTMEKTIGVLQYVRACLVPGGTLIVIGQHPSRWIDFVFGADRNYWSLSKKGTWLSNQHTALFWQQQLQQSDFSCVDIFELSPNTLSGPYLLAAQLSETAIPPAPLCQTTPCSWILLADDDGYSAKLSDHLTKIMQDRGDLVIQVCPGDVVCMESLLRDTTASYGQLDGIVYLAGLAPQPAPDDVEDVLHRQVARCAAAATILQACESTLTNTTCWLITAGAAANLLPEHGAMEIPSSAIVPSDAALWGFGRTVINEASNCSFRMVDLEDPLAVKIVAVALSDELKHPDKEQEVILTREGVRYVPRLRLEPRREEHHEIENSMDHPMIRLGFHTPGHLRNLRWELHPSRDPADGEVEVEVRATGLNFRDVMYALRLLSDEAVENGFAGSTLGLEFAGVVRSVGGKVSSFAPGDQVVGFGPSSFSNRVITPISAISHIPSGISFEAAATIPSTFFTAYYALHHLARLQPDEKLLIHGAAGGVGLAAIQLAKWIGAEIYATAGSDEKRDFLRLLGVDHIFDSRSLAFADEILDQTEGKGVDVVLNSLAGEAINCNFRVLKPFGRFLELGKRDFYENTKIGMRPFRNNISYFGIDADQLMQSRPELTRSLFVEVMALFAEGVLHPLPYYVFEAEYIVDAFRYMQQARQIGKIVVTYRNGVSHVHTSNVVNRKHLELRGDASYLVTGGLGGFGLRTAEWLACRGARHLILISRSGPSSKEAKEAIDRLTEQGVNVYAVPCDVTDKKAVSALLADTAIRLPPLKGIVHAAAVINDGLIRNMDVDQIYSVLAPKALGAYHLHAMTLDIPLDFFVLFSSATTLFGNPGQGNYVAANTCLEALANHRRACGLVATCVRWGAIDDVGFLARNENIKKALKNRMGGAPLHSAIALDILEEMLITDRSNLGVMELDWKILARFLPSAESPKFIELARHAGDSDGGEDHSDNIQRMLEDLTDTELLAVLIEMIKGEVGEILRVSIDKIDAVGSMYDMGLDSLMAVELIAALESGFGIRLPTMALSESPTITMLAKRIIRQLKESKTEDNDSEANEIDVLAKKLADQHGVEVSAEPRGKQESDVTEKDAGLRGT